VYRLLVQSYAHSFHLPTWGSSRTFLAAHQVASDGEETDVYLHLTGDEESVGGMGPPLADVVPFGDGWIEEGWLGECLLHGVLDGAIFDDAIGSVKLQGRVRGVLSIAMADLPLILGGMGVNVERQIY
jgi:hypothetical protein